MKLETLVKSKDAIIALTKEPLPLETAWDLSKFIKRLDPEVSTYEELRNKKIVELGYEKIENEKPTGVYVVKNENMLAFQAANKELLDKEIDILPPSTIKMSELQKYEDANGKKVNLSVAQLIALDWLIVD